MHNVTRNSKSRRYCACAVIIFLSALSLVKGDTYNVKIGTEHHVNLIDSRFLSFTIDPKYLFSSSDKYNSKECLCMASSLTPAYIRIAGPSTASLAFHNATLTVEDTIGDLGEPKKVHFQDKFANNLANRFRPKGTVENGIEIRFKRNHEKIEVAHREWRKFVHWAKATGFDLVFGLNNEERMQSGMWDPNTALNILSVAEKDNVGDIYWQLGYECKNQSIEEYLNDLETLRVIVETFPPGASRQWKVVGGDITKCLHQESKSDFKDYVTLSNDMMDAILLDGNSSSYELERMSERDRLKLLRLLTHSETPLWLSERPAPALDEVSRAADWLVGLGRAARNGFSHHFTELGDDMYQPSLSFYMALLFKNLVGSKVLDVNMEPDQAIMYAHCTSLRHQAVPGAVTLYAVNMEDEPARFSIKLDKKEEGGDILQFVLGHDHNGNIQVNGRPMYFDGDLKPVVKRVRPYKTLLINLPPRTFGFWVLANTNVNACYDVKDKDSNRESTETVALESDEIESIKSKRSLFGKDFDEYDVPDVSVDFYDDNETREKVENKNLKHTSNKLESSLGTNMDQSENKVGSKRLKRQIIDNLSERIRQFRKHALKNRNSKKTNTDEEKKSKRIFGNLVQFPKRNITRLFNKDKPKKLMKFSKNKVSKRTPHNKAKTTDKPLDEETIEPKTRSRRSTTDIEQVELSTENDVNIPTKADIRIWKILKKIQRELKDLSEEDNTDVIDEEDTKFSSSSENVLNEEDVKDNGVGIVKSTVGNLMRVLGDLNKNLRKAWKSINLLE